MREGKATIARRPAQPADHPFLFEVRRAAFRDLVDELFGWDDAEQHAAAMSEFTELHFEVIEADGVPIGHLCVVRLEDHDFIEEIALLREAQGHGIGGRILNDLIQDARGRNTKLRLSVFTNNPARRLYERLGFHITVIEPPRITMEA